MASPGPELRTPWKEVLLAALPAAVHAVFWLGRLHPDELFQVLEPGLNRAFGFGVVAWEWQVGLRNWALPGLVALILEGADKLGIHHPWAWRALIEVPQYFLHAAMLAAVWRLSARRVGERLARWCLWLLALYGPVVWFGGRTMGEALSAALLLWAFERLDVRENTFTLPLEGAASPALRWVRRVAGAALLTVAVNEVLARVLAPNVRTAWSKLLAGELSFARWLDQVGAVPGGWVEQRVTEGGAVGLALALAVTFAVLLVAWGLLPAAPRPLPPAPTLPAEAPGPVLLAGVLLGCAQVVRYGSAAVILPALLWLAATRRWKDLALTVGGGLVVAFFLGLLDKLTWGATLPAAHFAGEGAAVQAMNAVSAALPGWWHSFFTYVDFNVLSGRAAAQFGTAPAHLYLARLLLLPASLWGFWQWRRRPLTRAWLLVVPALFYAVVISATPHKEARFLYPALVLLCAAGLPAFVQWAAEGYVGGSARRRVGLAVLAAAGALFFIFPSPYDVERAEQFQLSAVGGREATGMVVVGEGLWGSPGFFYLGKNIPWFTCDFPEDGRFQAAMRDPRFNRMQTWDDRAVKEAEAFGFKVLERRGHGALLGR